MINLKKGGWITVLDCTLLLLRVIDHISISGHSYMQAVFIIS